ncbi:MAG TPA: DoxX family protein [Acidiferrobacteraceae bacterium]|nr:DoxX family protein [Acidiferrobacteraceae bacterium]
MNDNQANSAALLLRISLGIMFFAHALLKIFVFTLPGTVQFFASVGLPGALAYVVVVMELGGGLLLITGTGVRLVSLALLPILLGALYVHAGNGWMFSNANGGWEYPAFLAATTVVQAILGAGSYALKLPFENASTTTQTH